VLLKERRGERGAGEEGREAGESKKHRTDSGRRRRRRRLVPIH